MNVITKTVSLPDGRTISIETGKVAKQADGSVMLRMGNTVLLATVCAAKDAVPGTDFMPLQVDYRELYQTIMPKFTLMFSSSLPTESTSLTHWPVLQHQPHWPAQIYRLNARFPKCVSPA